MSRQVKLILVMVAMLIVLPVLTACPQPEAEVPTIRIGLLGPLKFTRGEHMQWGAQMAAEEINAAGGVNVGGVMHKIELIVLDTNELLSVSDAVSAMERVLTVDEVHFVAGTMRSEAVLAMQDIAMDHQTIYLVTSAAHPEITTRLAEDFERYKYTFRVNVQNSTYIGRMIFANISSVAEAVRRELGIEKPRVALLMEKAVWADPIITAAEGLLPQLGMEVAGVWRPSATAIDLTAELTAIKEAGAHMIMTGLTGPVGAVFGKQWGELKIPAAAVGVNSEGADIGYWETTGGFGEYEVVISTFAQKVEITPKTVPFVQAFMERFGELPMSDSTTYDTLYLLKEAIERAGSLDSDSVVVELQKTDFVATGGKTVFRGVDTYAPHCLMWGPEYQAGLGAQWRDGYLLAVWPDGRAVLGDTAWDGVRFKGTVDLKLPPWMIEFWEGKS